VTTNEETHVALVGYHPGAIIVVGSRAPGVHVMVVGVFRGPDVIVVTKMTIATATTANTT